MGGGENQCIYCGWGVLIDVVMGERWLNGQMGLCQLKGLTGCGIYLLHHNLLKHDARFPHRVSAVSSTFAVSEMRNQKLCVNPRHLTLEIHDINMSRIHCFRAKVLKSCYLTEPL